ncbi:MAG: DUF6064 family protein [Pseudomonadota bacterium]
MPLPFSAEQFLAVFAAYNLAVYPAQWLAYALAVLAWVLAWGGGALAGRACALILAAFWLASGLGYHWHFFAPINPLARVFGVLFMIQAAGFAIWALWPGRGRGPGFGPRRDGRGWTGSVIIVYALALYPLLGWALGHPWPNQPLVGLTPCPTTIFTFGLLLLTRRPVPLILLLIPVAWALIGAFAAVSMGMGEDAVLAVAGVAACALLLPRAPSGP